MKNRGFTLIELVIAIGLAALFIPAMVYVFSFSLGSASQGEKYTQAYAIAQEQMEAIYYLKENDPSWDWNNGSLNTVAGEYYQPKSSGSGWILGPKTTSPIQVDGYMAKVEILTGETADSESRTIVVTVLWEDGGAPSDISLMSYVTNH